jgi:hypothetical protein
MNAATAWLCFSEAVEVGSFRKENFVLIHTHAGVMIVSLAAAKATSVVKSGLGKWSRAS